MDSPTRGPLTHQNAVLLTLWGAGRPMVREELAVLAWERFPALFGMRRYNLPNVSAVYTKLYGAVGVVRRGWATQAGNVFTITPAGERAARALAPSRIPMGREQPVMGVAANTGSRSHAKR